ncbi:cell division cycle-associated protein 2 isoform 2-T3 [Anomaloglossus baeobatrachus]
MARRNILQEIPILVPETEQQSYEIVSEDEASIPYDKQTLFPTERPHSRYISNDESKENITPTQLENIFNGKTSQVTVLADIGDDSAPSSSTQTSHTSTEATAVSSPKKSMEASPEDPRPCDTPMDFGAVTVEDFGISSESFTTKSAEKSPKSLHKHRRRSTIGVRGSPEMNFLVRQIALQRSNRNSEPEPLDNPFTSPRNTTLRDKISAFRNAFQVVEETERRQSFPGFSEVKEELECETDNVAGVSEPPEKRMKLCDATNQGVSSVPHKPSVTFCPSLPLECTLDKCLTSGTPTDLENKASEVPYKCMPELTEETDCSRLATQVSGKPVEVGAEETQSFQSSSRSRKRKVMFTDLLLSPPEPEQSVPLISETSSGPVLKPVLKKTPKRDFVHFPVGYREEYSVFIPLPETMDDEEKTDAKSKSEDAVKHQKRVTFGRELSPELFDKSLPANTPLRRGSTPYNFHTLDASLSAEQSACQSPCEVMPQPNFDAKDEEESFLPLSLCFDDESATSDSPVSSPLPGQTEESSPDEEMEAAVAISGSTDAHDQETSCNKATEETGTQPDLDESIPPSLDVSFAGHRETRSSAKQKLSDSEEAPESNGSTVNAKVAAKRSRKPVIIKVQVKAPQGKGKKGRKSKKSVEKPVYSEREVVSKKPLLSPILELPESVPTPPAFTSSDLPQGKAVHKHFFEMVPKAGKEVKTQVASDYLEYKEPGTSPVHIVEDAETPDEATLEDMKVTKSGSPEKIQNIPASNALDLTSQGECPQSPSSMGVASHFSKLATNGLSTSFEKEKRSKTKNAKRRSSTRRSVSRPSIALEDADHTSHKPVQGTIVLSLDQNTTTSSSVLPITSEHKRSRRSSRIHQVSNNLPANHEQNTLVEHGPAMVPHSDSSIGDFCLPIDDILWFPPQEPKVRRSMRLRRDSGVIGLSWVAENKESETIGKRKSLSSVKRREESSALSLENTVHSPNKENLSGYQEPNLARKNRRRTLCTTTIQENVSTSDTRRRRSNCSYNAPSITPASDDQVHGVLVPDV